MVRKIPGHMLIGIVVATTVACFTGKVEITDVFGMPQINQSAVLKVDFRAAFTVAGLSYVAVFLFMDIFDTTGTLIAVSQQGGLMKDGQLPTMREAMVADSAGTIVGAVALPPCTPGRRAEKEHANLVELTKPFPATITASPPSDDPAAGCNSVTSTSSWKAKIAASDSAAVSERPQSTAVMPVVS